MTSTIRRVAQGSFENAYTFLLVALLLITFVMPLIAGTEYREFIELSRGARIGEYAGDPHRGSLLHLALAINRSRSPTMFFIRPKSSAGRSGRSSGFTGRLVV